MDHAKQSLAQFLFHQAGDVPADLATAIALVNDEIVPVLMIQRRAGQALLFYVRRVDIEAVSASSGIRCRSASPVSAFSAGEGPGAYRRW